LAQHPFRSFAGCNVAHNAGETPLSANDVFADRELDREKAAILAPALSLTRPMPMILASPVRR